MKVSIIGAGSWGSALALSFSLVADISLYCRNVSQAEYINTQHINPGYIPDGVILNNNITATSNLTDCLNADLIIVATPLNALRSILLQIKDFIINASVIPDIIWVCKGFELNTGMLPHQVFNDVFSDVQNIPKHGALLGPSFAQDVANKLPTVITLASNKVGFAFKWIEVFRAIPYLRIYASQDVIGAEIGAGVKNVVAIATGIIDGLGLGLNARAALITRSMHELSRLVKKLGGSVNTVYGLTGIGDLILTCTGNLSRNRQVGLELAKGKQLDEIINNLGHVAEGVYSTNEVYKLSHKLGVDMPIVDTVYNVINGNIEIKDSVFALLNREPKEECL